MQNKFSDFTSRVEYIIDTYFEGNKTRFAKEVGKTRQYFNRMARQDKGEEKGDPNPTLEVLTNIVSATGVNPTWLLTGEGEPIPDPALTLVADRTRKYEDSISDLRNADIDRDDLLEFLLKRQEELLDFVRNELNRSD